MFITKTGAFTVGGIVMADHSVIKGKRSKNLPIRTKKRYFGTSFTDDLRFHPIMSLINLPVLQKLR